MGTAERIERLGSQIFALSQEFTEDRNERRFLVHATLLEMLSADPDVAISATSVDCLRELVQSSHRKAQKLVSNPDRCPAPDQSGRPTPDSISSCARVKSSPPDFVLRLVGLSGRAQAAGPVPSLRR